MKSVYIINGFLDSGKTEFIQYTLAQPYFKTKGTTLLIVCEEGENEYDEKLLKATSTILVNAESEEDISADKLMELDKKHKPSRVIIEYNGMWNYKNFKLPFLWRIEQQITTIDASTFPLYYTNMKSLLAEMIRKSEMIIFNRCDGIKELSNYKRNIKAINQNAEIIFEDKNGEVNEMMEEELPYDLKQDTIVLTDSTYGIWYLDSLDHLERYEGKMLEFVANVFKPAEFPKEYFVPGRMAMTCCAEDMAFLGFACKYDGADQLKDRSWIKITVKVAKEYFEGYQQEGPVLHAISVEPTKAPKDEVISFT